MIKVTTNISETSVKLGKWMAQVGGAGRRMIYSRAAYHVANLVRNHLLRLGSWKHIWAERLGAQPTGFLQEAGRKTTSHASENGGEVVIPAPLGRAFHDVEIRPKKWKYLTIPAAPEAYGKRASILADHGWSLYMPKGKRFITGYKKGVGSKILYWLHESVKQEQDRELLPDDKSMREAANAGVIAALTEMRRRAS